VNSIAGLATLGSEEARDDGDDKPAAVFLDGISLNLFRRVPTAAPCAVEREVAPEAGATELRRKTLAIHHSGDHLGRGGAAFRSLGATVATSDPSPELLVCHERREELMM